MALDSSPSNLQKMAIDAALNCKWNEALDYNRELIKIEPENVDCLNRLAKAYLELGKYLQAKKIYNDVLKLDPYNSIAQKNLKKVSSFKKNTDGIPTNGHASIISPSIFLEEPGLTKVVPLTKVAEPQKLLILSAGTQVQFLPKNRGLAICDSNNQYVGALPDDAAFHLLKLIKGGNQYQVFIKSVKQNAVTVIIREVFRSKKFKNQASFLDEAKILSYSSDHLALNNDDEGDESDESGEDDVVI